MTIRNYWPRDRQVAGRRHIRMLRHRIAVTKEAKAVLQISTTNRLQAWTEPEGPRSLRLADFQTFGT
jgi:hypothetical protein